MFHWYVVNTYSGHENKVKANLEHRRQSMSQEDRIQQIVVPTEQIVETKEGQKVTSERRVFPATCSCRWSSPTTPGRSSRTPRA